MKKVFSVMLLMAMAMQLCAQSVVGNWKSQYESKEAGKVDIYYNLKADKTCAVTIDANMTKQETATKILVKIHFDVKGTYAVNGKKLALKYDKTTANTGLDIDIDAPGADKSKVEGIKQMVQALFAKQKDQLVSKITDDLKLTQQDIVSVSEKQLVLKNVDGVTFSFNKVADAAPAAKAPKVPAKKK